MLPRNTIVKEERKKDLLGPATKAEEFGLIELDMKVGLMDMEYGDAGT